MKRITPLFARSAIFAASLALGFAHAPAATQNSTERAPQISVRPSGRVLLGDAVGVVVSNLRPGQAVVLRATTTDTKGRRWNSSGFYRADARGVVDTARQASEGGTYLGVDQWGLFWSMTMAADTPEGEREPAHFQSGFADNKRSNVVRVEAREGGRTLAGADIELVYIAPEVTITPVRENGIVGNFHAPSAAPPRGRRWPGVIVVGGSEGGMHSANATAKLLSSRGYAVLALAYFNMETLPAQLEEIPLEYFKRAIDWMRANPSVDAERLAFAGSSKGGEAALLVASTYPEVKAVVAYVPAHAAFQSIRFGGQQTVKSSWSFQGRPVPFVPYAGATERHDGIRAVYLDGLGDSEAARAALIPVERIRGPVLVISGTDDRLWPSGPMAERVVERLRKERFRFPYQHLSYEGAGHSLTAPAQIPLAGPPSRFPLGGTDRANANARADAFLKVVAFLDEHLKK
ncbi:MAG TPA: acyl-CoA thioester hydrolase/BAAT C-terminal domain-containing protein [Pyrinomonadaceae bacterium]|nr:acyl-CoA thioester hydrolase/BAAT C-terminal domain-containing protein [Pyrinomonadaceae bacterium]